MLSRSLLEMLLYADDKSYISIWTRKNWHIAADKTAARR